MDILIGLIPAIAWGIIPLSVSKIGGKPIEQILGTTAGAFLVGCLVFFTRQPDISQSVFFFSFLSGAFWACGQMLQYTAYTKMGVSKAMPITTGMQLIGVSLLGVIAFGEWASSGAKLLGFGAISLIIIGAFFTSYQEKKTSDQPGNFKQGFFILLVSTIGYVGYSGLPQLAAADGWTKFFPQTIGMVTTSILLAFFMTGGKALKEAKTFQNFLSGFIFSIGAMAYLLSISMNGVTIGFALSQMNVILSTLGSIFILGEKKTKKEFIFVLIGLLFVVCGGISINFIPK